MSWQDLHRAYLEAMVREQDAERRLEQVIDRERLPEGVRHGHRASWAVRAICDEIDAARKGHERALAALERAEARLHEELGS